MSDKRYLGNIITPNPTEPAGPFQDDAAPGVWSLQEAFTYTKAGLWPTAGNAPPTAFFAGGDGGTNTISKVLIGTTGNATAFGSLSNTEYRGFAAVGSSSRIIHGGGLIASTGTNVIAFITVAAGGDTTDFGDLSGPAELLAACSSSTRGVFAGGNVSSTRTNALQFITMASAGNATDFGDLLEENYQLTGMASATRGVFSGGQDNPGGTSKNTIQFITIASAGNATDFGDIDYFASAPASCSNSTRGLIAGGFREQSVQAAYNNISFVTIASAGNATDFGDLNAARNAFAAASSETRAIFTRGYSSNAMEYVTIATTGNSLDFGDLPQTNNGFLYGASNAHGGLS